MKHMWNLIFSVVAAVVVGGLYGTGRILPPDASTVHGLSDADLDAAMASDPAMPLALGQTDVLLVIACTLRQDRLEPYGHTRPTSPFLARLAVGGVLFRQHFTQAPWTRPSIGSIVTGRWPRALQLDNPGKKGALSLVLAERHTLLSEVLEDAGYQTFSATGNPNIKERFGFTQGVSTFVEPEGVWTDGNIESDDADLVKATLDFAAQLDPDERLYARVVLTGAHLPRQFRWRDRGLFTGSEKKLVDPYDTSVRRLDSMIGRLVSGLSERNLLVVIVSDHGEGLRLPKHHGSGHGNHLYPSTTAGVFLLHHPSLPSGHTVQGLSMNIDVHPTILGLLGAPSQHSIDGTDLSAAARGASQTGHEQVFAETFYLRTKKSAVFDAEHYLIRNHKTDQDVLFSRSDAAGQDPIQEPDVTRRLAAALSTWRGEQAASVRAPAIEVEVSAETRQQLEAMGYME